MVGVNYGLFCILVLSEVQISLIEVKKQPSFNIFHNTNVTNRFYAVRWVRDWDYIFKLKFRLFYLTSAKKPSYAILEE